MKNATVKSVVHTLIDMLDKGTLHLDDYILLAGVLGKVTDENPLKENEQAIVAKGGYPEGTLNLLIRSADKDSAEDTDLYIFMKEKEEETKA